MSEYGKFLRNAPNCSVNKGVEITQRLLSENIPYQLYPVRENDTDKTIVFDSKFITLFRTLLSEPNGESIIKLNVRERKVWYAFVAYQNGEVIEDAELLAVVMELEKYVMGEIALKTEVYIDDVTDDTHTWNEYPMKDAPVEHTTLLESAYALLVANGQAKDSVVYVVTDINDVKIHVYAGTTLLM